MVAHGAILLKQNGSILIERLHGVRSLSGHVRYFIIKSFSMRDVQISQAKGIWATQNRNEAKLNEAYENADNVLLIFSVNESRHFQGYARMASRIGDKHSPVWTQVDGTQTWGGTFRVEWLTVYPQHACILVFKVHLNLHCHSFDVPFGQTLHIRNPLNSNKPVKISRDGQELATECGLQLCMLVDEVAASDPSGASQRPHNNAPMSNMKGSWMGDPRSQRQPMHPTHASGWILWNASNLS